MSSPLSPFEDARRQVGTLTIASLLAVVGGSLDAFTYIGHGRVFSNAMTANVLLLGINCAAGAWADGLRHVPAILAFLIGVGVAQAIHIRARRHDRGVPYVAILGMETAVLAVLSFLPTSTPDLVYIISIAFAASMQVESFREVNGRSFNSTFTTGNLRTLSEAALGWLMAGRAPAEACAVRDFAIICLSFLAGAVAGAYFVRDFGNHALLFDVALLAVISAIIAAEPPSAPHSTSPPPK